MALGYDPVVPRYIFIVNDTISILKTKAKGTLKRGKQMLPVITYYTANPACCVQYSEIHNQKLRGPGRLQNSHIHKVTCSQLYSI